MPLYAGTVCANIAGPLEVWFGVGTPSVTGINTPAAGPPIVTAVVPLHLGWTMNGVNIEEEPRFAPIHDDQNGGDQGAPTGYQRFFGNHVIEGEFVRGLPASMEVLGNLLNPTNQNLTVPADVLPVGGEIVCGNRTFHLWLRGTPQSNFVRHYPKCVIVDPIRLGPIGSQKTTHSLRLTAMHYVPPGASLADPPSNGIFYNNNMTALTV